MTRCPEYNNNDSFCVTEKSGEIKTIGQHPARKILECKGSTFENLGISDTSTDKSALPQDGEIL
jgi:hypothetical protein